MVLILLHPFVSAVWVGLLIVLENEYGYEINSTLAQSSNLKKRFGKRLPELVKKKYIDTRFSKTEDGPFFISRNLETVCTGSNMSGPTRYNSSTNKGSIKLRNQKLFFIKIIASSDSRVCRSTAASIMFDVLEISISNSGIQKLSNLSWVNFPNLQHLHLSGNRIWHVDPHTFTFLHKLETLDLSENSLNALELDFIVRSLPSLIYLNVSNNHISTLMQPRNITSADSIIKHKYWTEKALSHNWTSSLKIIDLQNNEMKEMPCSYVSLTKNVTINMNGNPVQCQCRVYDRGKQNNVTHLENCTCPMTTNPQSSINNNCRDSMHVNFSVSFQTVYLFISIIVLFSVTTLLFCYKRNYRQCPDVHCIHLAQRVCRHVPAQSIDDITYSAFIVCDVEDLAILERVVDELETKRGLKIVFESRDAQPGHRMIRIYEDWLVNSKRTLFLISSNFLQNLECMYVLDQARSMGLTHGRHVSIIIKLENLSGKDKKQMHALFLKNICFEYNQTDEFWGKLAASINNIDEHVHIVESKCNTAASLV